MKKSLSVAFLFALGLGACTTVPDRYSRDTIDPSNCGYRIEKTEAPGFALEVFYREYKFFPMPDEPVQGAKQCFLRTAERLSKLEGKKMKPILLGDLNAAPTRNTMDGTYAVFVSGRVQFQE